MAATCSLVLDMASDLNRCCCVRTASVPPFDFNTNNYLAFLDFPPFSRRLDNKSIDAFRFVSVACCDFPNATSSNSVLLLCCVVSKWALSVMLREREM